MVFAIGAVVLAVAMYRARARERPGRAPPERTGAAPCAEQDAEVAQLRRQVTVVHVATNAASLVSVSGQAAYLRAHGFAFRTVSSPGPDLQAFAAQEGADVSAVPMPSGFAPLRAALAVLRLWRVITAARASVVYADAPAGARLALLAACLARTPVRVYGMRRLQLRAATLPRRVLLWADEWVACALAHRVLAANGSLRLEAIREGLCPTAKILVLADGCGDGVDAAGNFRPLHAEGRRAARARLGIPEDAVVVGFVGTLARDEGIAELDAAFRRLRDADRRLHLVLVGNADPRDVRSGLIVATLRGEPCVHVAGDVEDLASAYGAMDVLALPPRGETSSRVALEAAAMALPVVATRVPGCVDAVVDGQTGLLVPPGDPGRLASALARYVADPALRVTHGEAARRRVVAAYQRERIWDALAIEYRSLVDACGAGARRKGST
ncbi:glycosyltransferase [Anaeromyxobacter oryzae]|nr:glycosyltransferase [Anaeromyxobacter oryzae]